MLLGHLFVENFALLIEKFLFAETKENLKLNNSSSAQELHEGLEMFFQL